MQALRVYYRHGPKLGQELIWNTLLAHLWWAEGQIETRTWFGARMAVSGGDMVGRYIAYFGIWEPSLTAWLAQRLKPGDTFVDVGANIGYFTLLASQLVGRSGRVIAIEPSPANLELLEQNVSANRAANVRIIPAAVSDAVSELTLYADGVNGMTTLDAKWAGLHSLPATAKVPVAPLPDLVGDERPAVIKIDVERHELPVLRSAAPLLGRCPAVAVEVLEANVSSALTLMAPFGYEPLEMPNDYSVAAYIKRRVVEPEPLADLAGRGQIDLIFTNPVAPGFAVMAQSQVASVEVV